MKQFKVIALMGKSGSGKDWTASYLCEQYPNLFHKVISDTTRPIRDCEQDGVDYYFIDAAEFASEVLNGNMLEATCYNGNWYYGTNITSLDENKVNVAVMNPEGVSRLSTDPRVDLIPILITSNPRERLMQTLTRENHPDCTEICRRFLADEKDFEDLYRDYDIDKYYSVWNSYTTDYKVYLDQLITIKFDRCTWSEFKDKIGQFIS